jgi:hypothetical protein
MNVYQVPTAIEFQTLPSVRGAQAVTTYMPRMNDFYYSWIIDNVTLGPWMATIDNFDDSKLRYPWMLHGTNYVYLWFHAQAAYVHLADGSREGFVTY